MVEQTEADLKAVFPQPTWNGLHLRLLLFGREHCPAARHDPQACAICSWAAVAPYNRHVHLSLTVILHSLCETNIVEGNLEKGAHAFAT